MAWTEQLNQQEQISTEKLINKQVGQNIDGILPAIKDKKKKKMIADLKPVLWKSLHTELGKEALKFLQKWKNKESALQNVLL